MSTQGKPKKRKLNQIANDKTSTDETSSFKRQNIVNKYLVVAFELWNSGNGSDDRSPLYRQVMFKFLLENAPLEHTCQPIIDYQETRQKKENRKKHIAAKQSQIQKESNSDSSSDSDSSFDSDFDTKSDVEIEGEKDLIGDFPERVKLVCHKFVATQEEAQTAHEMIVSITNVLPTHGDFEALFFGIEMFTFVPILDNLKDLLNSLLIPDISMICIAYYNCNYFNYNNKMTTTTTFHPKDDIIHVAGVNVKPEFNANDSIPRSSLLL
jgi:hypothetical protein